MWTQRRIETNSTYVREWRTAGGNNKFKRHCREYILVKKDDKYGVYSADGEIIAPIEYKKIRLERNSLEGQKNNKTWEKI